MKLLQCNIQGRKHIDKIQNLLETHNPDVVCLQEADGEIISVLIKLGYTTKFLPIIKRQAPEGLVDEGVVLAARDMQNVEERYYYFPTGGITLQNDALHRETTAHGYIIGDCNVGGANYRICTTHFTWTARGDIACQDQKDDMKTLLGSLSGELAHILCGDFNIPRGFNPLYGELCAYYEDNIPLSYTSSLDKNFHRMGNVASRSHLFTHFMVDYIFTQSPYRAENVELIFGVSDHAAVVADVYLT
ncbi:MAG: endonuclease/exonuclease/phosphatase family protein [Candidatus Paceibacteria bacterium]